MCQHHFQSRENEPCRVLCSSCPYCCPYFEVDVARTVPNSHVIVFCSIPLVFSKFGVNGAVPIRRTEMSIGHSNVRSSIARTEMSIGHSNVHSSCRRTEMSSRHSNVHSSNRPTEMYIGQLNVHSSIGRTEISIGRSNVHSSIGLREMSIGNLNVHRTLCKGIGH